MTSNNLKCLIKQLPYTKYQHILCKLLEDNIRYNAWNSIYWNFLNDVTKLKLQMNNSFIQYNIIFTKKNLSNSFYRKCTVLNGDGECVCLELEIQPRYHVLLLPVRQQRVTKLLRPIGSQPILWFHTAAHRTCPISVPSAHEMNAISLALGVPLARRSGAKPPPPSRQDHSPGPTRRPLLLP